MRGPLTATKLRPKEGLARFVLGATLALAKLGFAPAKTKDRWTRTLPSGVVHELSLNLGTREPRPSVAMADARIPALLARATGSGELPAMGLEYLWFKGLVPERAWSTSERARFEYEICHTECVDKSVRAFARTVGRFAVPLFERASTLAELDAFFRTTEPFVPSRKNWELGRERASGAADRFWRADRGLLLIVATAALARPKAQRACFANARRRAAEWRRKGLYGAPATLLDAIDALEAALANAEK